MSLKPLTPLQRAWYKWKSLHLPWRKRFLIGFDLQNNTFWEFRDTLSSHKHRMRRIVQYPASTHYSDIVISPQWHQWLRHTRRDAPSIAEQSQDLVRQENLKVLARQADERWKRKESLLESPKNKRVEMRPALRGMPEPVSATSGNIPREGSEEGRPTTSEEDPTMHVPGDEEHAPHGRLAGTMREKKIKDDPWKKARGAPSEDWQPSAWSPNSRTKRS